MKARITETEIGRAVVAWLVADGWDVYQEVYCGGSTCDVVAVRGPLLWAIECKTSLSFDVLEQALHWRGRAHFVAVAVPEARSGRYAYKICEDYGIGVIVVGVNSVSRRTEAATVDCRQRVPPAFNRRAAETLKMSLLPEQKQSVAGSAGGGHWTPFKETCRRLADIVRHHVDGIEAKVALANIHHHYRTDASARASLLAWAAAGKVPGVRVDRGDRLKFFPAKGVA